MFKPTVAHVVQHLSPGGIETMALDMIGTDENRYVVSLEGTKEQALRNWPRLNAYSDRLIFMNKKRGLDPRLPFRFARELKDLGVHVVHTHHIGPLLYGGLAALIAGTPVRVHTEHDAWHLDNPKRRRLQGWVAEIVKPAFIADTNAVADAVRRHLPKIGVDVITNGIDTVKFDVRPQAPARAVFGLPQDVQLIGCAARLEAVKGHIYLIDALSSLPGAVHLALAGDGSLRTELETRARNLGVAERVHFLGAIDDMPAFYNAIDVFCLPSLNEGMPLSPLEAQASGVRVVATDVGGSASSVCPDSGILVPSQDAGALADALGRALFQSESAEPRGFVRRNADLRKTRAAYEQLYRSKEMKYA